MNVERERSDGRCPLVIDLTEASPDARALGAKARLLPPTPRSPPSPARAPSSSKHSRYSQHPSQQSSAPEKNRPNLLRSRPRALPLLASRNAFSPSLRAR